MNSVSKAGKVFRQHKTVRICKNRKITDIIKLNAKFLNLTIAEPSLRQ